MTDRPRLFVVLARHPDDVLLLERTDKPKDHPDWSIAYQRTARSLDGARAGDTVEIVEGEHGPLARKVISA